ncbi:unnamed protein product [Vitrella brassicaformis CCMP3155]|uniref:TRP C-terminal domain-containing protein n=6 Tax=Vitrella brassicaformis TaxID=1169539 RepID=A0A0G4EHQ4_VITBC|nr:unnamed protein product [Vitrella brassicaformis CCMP3155]|eukprot:CEL95720.1 unnamed protein product [Vitrella brassicaformis CCMP3155]
MSVIYFWRGSFNLPFKVATPNQVLDCLFGAGSLPRNSTPGGVPEPVDANPYPYYFWLAAPVIWMFVLTLVGLPLWSFPVIATFLEFFFKEGLVKKTMNDLRKRTQRAIKKRLSSRKNSKKSHAELTEDGASPSKKPSRMWSRSHWSFLSLGRKDTARSLGTNMDEGAMNVSSLEFGAGKAHSKSGDSRVAPAAVPVAVHFNSGEAVDDMVDPGDVLFDQDSPAPPDAKSQGEQSSHIPVKQNSFDNFMVATPARQATSEQEVASPPTVQFDVIEQHATAPIAQGSEGEEAAEGTDGKRQDATETQGDGGDVAQMPKGALKGRTGMWGRLSEGLAVRKQPTVPAEEETDDVKAVQHALLATFNLAEKSKSRKYDDRKSSLLQNLFLRKKTGKDANATTEIADEPKSPGLKVDLLDLAKKYREKNADEFKDDDDRAEDADKNTKGDRFASVVDAAMVEDRREKEKALMSSKSARSVVFTEASRDGEVDEDDNLESSSSSSEEEDDNKGPIRILGIFRPRQTVSDRMIPQLKAFFIDMAPAYIICIFLLWPEVTERMLSLVECGFYPMKGYRDDEMRLMQNLDVICGSELYYQWIWLAFTGLLFWSAGGIFAVWVILYLNRKRLNVPKVRSVLGFLYNGYEMKEPLYYWELVQMFRKLLVLIVTFVPIPDVRARLILYGMVATAALALHVSFGPYDNRQDGALDKLESFSLFSWIITLMLLQLMLIFGEDFGPDFNTVCAVGLVIVNGYFLYLAIYYLIRDVGVSQLQSIADKAAVKEAGVDKKEAKRLKREERKRRREEKRRSSASSKRSSIFSFLSKKGQGQEDGQPRRNSAFTEAYTRVTAVFKKGYEAVKDIAKKAQGGRERFYIHPVERTVLLGGEDAEKEITSLPDFDWLHLKGSRSFNDNSYLMRTLGQLLEHCIDTLELSPIPPDLIGRIFLAAKKIQLQKKIEQTHLPVSVKKLAEETLTNSPATLATGMTNEEFQLAAQELMELEEDDLWAALELEAKKKDVGEEDNADGRAGLADVLAESGQLIKKEDQPLHGLFKALKSDKERSGSLALADRDDDPGRDGDDELVSPGKGQYARGMTEMPIEPLSGKATRQRHGDRVTIAENHERSGDEAETHVHKDVADSLSYADLTGKSASAVARDEGMEAKRKSSEDIGSTGEDDAQPVFPNLGTAGPANPPSHSLRRGNNDGSEE